MTAAQEHELILEPNLLGGEWLVARCQCYPARYWVSASTSDEATAWFQEHVEKFNPEGKTRRPKMAAAKPKQAEEQRLELERQRVAAAIRADALTLALRYHQAVGTLRPTGDPDAPTPTMNRVLVTAEIVLGFLYDDDRKAGEDG